MATPTKSDRPNPSSRKAPVLHEDRPPGPVPQRHRMRLGEGDGMTNPFGADAPSTKNMVANNQGKTY